MAANQTISCPVCGFENPKEASRCASCGARLESLLGTELTEEERRARRNQQEGFEWRWVGVAFGIYLAMQTVMLAILPIVLPMYDPQGTAGLGISVVVWFVGGALVGLISPGRTFFEPAVGALIAVIPTVAWLVHIDVLYDVPLIFYVVGGLIGVMMTLFGAFIGERGQMMIRGE
ncbi:MAG TPA: zinc finger Ran-binding domain-containing protein [Polyangiaceae bacterium LLY-WYZ-14_1]|nr:zinc finger Ran-binding domain-containing protein [Polyangiaceae bacterium LLY-WYZ-14_1]